MKSFRSHPELVQILAGRGMDVGDPAAAEVHLRRHGYHRLGGYRYPFRKMLPPALSNPQARTYRADDYEPGSKLDDVVGLAEFDGRLRRVCLEGLLEFEVRLRSALAHVLSRRDPHAHVTLTELDQSRCQALTAGGGTKFDAWCATVAKAETRFVDEDYVAHHQALSLGPNMPAWAMVELLEFGSLPYLMDLMRDDDLNEVAGLFGVRNGRQLAPWVRAFADLRNAAAHNQRLFNRTMKRAVAVKAGAVNSPLLDHVLDAPASRVPAYPVNNRRLYKVSAVLAYTLRSHEAGTNWHMTFKTAIRKLPVIQIDGSSGPLITPETSMGFPVAWESLALWTA